MLQFPFNTIKKKDNSVSKTSAALEYVTTGKSLPDELGLGLTLTCGICGEACIMLAVSCDPYELFTGTLTGNEL